MLMDHEPKRSTHFYIFLLMKEKLRYSYLFIYHCFNILLRIDLRNVYGCVYSLISIYSL